MAADLADVSAAEADALSLLELARDGDRSAFNELAGAHRAELRARCYRIVGSMDDAEDALQEGLLRAWRGLGGFEGRGSLRSWLYAIVSNAALDLTRHRSRREVPVVFGGSAGAGTGLDLSLTEQPRSDPCADRWLSHDARLSPEARYEQRESIELAFLVAVQHLPPLQRAALLLREVVGFSTAEISIELGTTAASVNSALQRARSAVRRRKPTGSQRFVPRTRGDKHIRALVQRYADVLESCDWEELIDMLTDDAEPGIGQRGLRADAARRKLSSPADGSVRRSQSLSIAELSRRRPAGRPASRSARGGSVCRGARLASVRV